jgi:hypothetical protein
MMLPTFAPAAYRQEDSYAEKVLSASVDKTGTHLDVSSKLINNTPVHYLPAFLNKHPTITALDLSGNKKITLTEAETQVLCSILTRNGQLKELDLSHNKFSMPCLRNLCCALNTDLNASIEHLNLSNLKLDRQCIALLMGSDKDNSSLRQLNLKNNEFYKSGAMTLAKNLPKYKNLQYLNLNRNNIDPQGAQVLAQALEANQTITDLQLRGNCIGEEGIGYIREALKVNTSIKRLNISRNLMHFPSAQALSIALKENYALVYLKFQDSCMTDEKGGLPRYLNKKVAAEREQELNITINTYLKRNKDRVLATMFFACLCDKESSEGIKNPFVSAAVDGRIAPELTQHIMSFLVGDRASSIEQETSKRIFKPRLIEPAPQLLKELDQNKPKDKKQAFWLVRACKLWNQAEETAVNARS